MQETNSDRQQVRENKSIVTLSEATARGIPFGENARTPPPVSKCKFCGKILEPLGLVVFGRVMVWRDQRERCDCPEAKRRWAELDKIEKARQEEEERKRQQAVMNERIERLIGRSGIKKRFMQRTFPNFKTDTPERKECFKIAKSYADNFPIHLENGEGLYIEGTNGTGKTHLAAAIALQLLNSGVPVICKTASEMLIDIKTSFDKGGRSERDILDIYKSVDLLVIDDLGKEQCTEWSMSILYTILNSRYEDMKPVIITTNYNVEYVTKALTPKGGDPERINAIMSRFKETSKKITMSWEDIRKGDKSWT